jgi:UDP-glucose 4-epimerase
MNILITGAGLIGCHFAREMAQRGHQAVVYDIAPNEGYVRSVARDVSLVRGDVRDLPALLETMQAHRVDTVFHTAGLIGGKVAERPYSGMGINVGGAIAVAEATRLSGAERLVFASTFGVYNWGLSASAPINEDFPLGGDSLYGGSKVACEQIFRGYGAKYGFEAIMLRFAQVYGRGHYVGGSSGGQAMHEIVASVADGKPVRIVPRHFGINEYVYVKDAVQGAVLACETSVKSKAFNIGTGHLASPEDLVAAIGAVRPGLEVQVEAGPAERPGQRRTQPLDLTRARQELGYAPRFDLVEGIADFVQELRVVA